MTTRDSARDAKRRCSQKQGLYGALAELARRPEYIEPLREEAELIFARVGANVSGCDRMILLDSFLKECQRLHPPAAGMYMTSILAMRQDSFLTHKLCSICASGLQF